jgi:ATP-dependent exoDNAse (exonuclease V) alpha subunit
MAIFRLQINPISRAAGRSAPAAAAYRAGERIRDERTGVLHNHSRRTDVSHKEILLPSGLQGADLAWATDRARLWNAAERAERRRNSRVAREYQVALAPELNAAQRLQLVRSFARELADRHNVAVDLAVHAPRAEGDPRNHHAHLLATTRQITPGGFGAKAGLDMQGVERQRRGLLMGIAEIKALRERWAVMSNEALAAAGLDVRIEHRSLRARGIDREPRPSIPLVMVHMERRGLRSEVAERIRERYRARVQERLARAAQRSATAAPLDLEAVRRQAREAWLQLRSQAVQQPEPAPWRPNIKESPQMGSPSPARSPASRSPASRSPAEPSPGEGTAAERHRSRADLERDAADRDFAL